MPTTLKHGISYPSGSVAPNIPVVMQAQAQSVEAALEALVNKDARQVFRNGGYGWSGGAAPWDAGTLSADATAAVSAQVSSPLPTFVTPGGLSGTLKFTQPGLYAVKWIIFPTADPGSAGYRVIPTGTWPGSPSGVDAILGQTQRHAGSQFWESVVEAEVRVPAAGLEIRMTGQQANATTNQARVFVTQRSKLA